MSSNEMTVVNGLEYPAELVKKFLTQLAEEYSDKLQELVKFAKATSAGYTCDCVDLPADWQKHYREAVIECTSIINDSGEPAAVLLYVPDDEDASKDHFLLVQYL